MKGLLLALTQLDETLHRIEVVKDVPVEAFWSISVYNAKGYFEKIQAVLKKYDIFLVADEVICGFWRTGNYWGCGTLNIKPDILTCAKAISSSYLPVSAVMVNERIFQALSDESHAIGTFGHGYTYTAHPVGCAISLKTIEIYQRDKIMEHAAKVSPVFQSRLMKLADGKLSTASTVARTFAITGWRLR